MRRALWLALAVPAVLAAAPTDDPEALSRRADAAFDAGRAEAAAELYDRAGVRTTEPARAAFNLATVRYRQAKEGQLAALGPAELHYRACLSSPEYRARALFGLGNCLSLRATAGTALERSTLRAAIDLFGDCVEDEGCDPSLRRDAKYNRARARLLLLQAPPPRPGEEPGDEPKDESPKEDPKDDKSRTKEGEPKDGDPKKKDKAGAEPSKDADDGKQGDAAGRGKLPPPPRDDGGPPLAREDAERHLEAAAKKILDEAAAHRRGKAKPAGPGVRDW